MDRYATPEEIWLWRAAMATNAPPPRLPPSRADEPAWLDLHGYSVHDAYQATLAFLRQRYQRGQRHATVITGKSGQICREFRYWLEPLTYVAAIEQNGSRGSFLVTLRRNRR